MHVIYRGDGSHEGRHVLMRDEARVKEVVMQGLHAMKRFSPRTRLFLSSVRWLKRR